MTDKEKDYGKIKELYKQGYDISEIAEKLDIPEFAVLDYLWSVLVYKPPVVKAGKITIITYNNTDEEEE